MINHVPQQEESMEALVQILRVLSDPTRLRLLEALRDGERNVSSLCESLELAQPTVSHHLALLRSSGLVRPRRNGKQIFYSLQTNSVQCAESMMAFYAGGLELRVQPSGNGRGVAGPATSASVPAPTDEMARQSA